MHSREVYVLLETVMHLPLLLHQMMLVGCQSCALFPFAAGVIRLQL